MHRKGIPHMGESARRTEEMRQRMCNKAGYAAGGRVKAYPEMKAGGDSGLGRLQKAHEQGKKTR